MRVLVTLLFVLVPAADPSPVTYQPPVDAAVTEPFRPPAGRYGPGHRGLEYGTVPGDEVRAAAAGRVVYAGPVAGRRYVTVLHADGVRTAYGPLATIAVRMGQPVAAGAAIGTAAGPLLWTARIADAYVDPAVLLVSSGHRSVHLVAGPSVSTPVGQRPRAPVTACAAAWALARPC